MDELRTVKIRSLAEEAERKRQRLNMLMALNTHGLSDEDRMRQAADYAVAQAEMFEANAMLRRAQEPTC